MSVYYQFPSRVCHVLETGITRNTSITQYKASARPRYLSYRTTLRCLDTGHRFQFADAKIIERDQGKVGILFIEANHSDEISMNRPITLGPWYVTMEDPKDWQAAGRSLSMQHHTILRPPCKNICGTLFRESTLNEV